jgi:Domain of unknown function (DUF929)
VPGLSGLPASASSGIAYSSTLLIEPDTLKAVSGPPLTLSAKPEVLYVADEYCPYCAMENWPLIVALSRFGKFTGLTTSRSTEFDHIAPVDSWTFYGSRYTSPYLSFVPVQRRSNVVDEFLHAGPGGLCGEHVLERVVVGPGLEPDLVPGAPAVAGEHVGLHEFQREAQVRAGIDVRDRGGDVNPGHRNLQLDRGSDRANQSRPRKQGLGNERPVSVGSPASGASSG